nr:unnamed protein product [Digitaria exilis]
MGLSCCQPGQGRNATLIRRVRGAAGRACARASTVRVRADSADDESCERSSCEGRGNGIFWSLTWVDTVYGRTTMSI